MEPPCCPVMPAGCVTLRVPSTPSASAKEGSRLRYYTPDGRRFTEVKKLEEHMKQPKKDSQATPLVSLVCVGGLASPLYVPPLCLELAEFPGLLHFKKLSRQSCLSITGMKAPDQSPVSLAGRYPRPFGTPDPAAEALSPECP